MRLLPRHRLGSRTEQLAAGVLALLTIGPLVRSAAASTDARIILLRSRPAWAATATEVGPATGSLSVRIVMAPRAGEPALQAAVAAVSTPGTPLYRHFLTPAQYRLAFAPSQAQVDAVSAWLRGAGLTVQGMDAGARMLSATGSAADVEAAFGTHLALYQRGSSEVRAPTTDVSIPADLAGNVLGVLGLESPTQLSPDEISDGAADLRPCSTWDGQLAATVQADRVTPLPRFNGRSASFAPCGYVPSQLRTAYGIDRTKLTGAGVTVAVTGAYAGATLRADADTYARLHGDPAFVAGQLTRSGPGLPFDLQQACDAPAWHDQETLGVQAVHALATGANVAVYAARSCTDGDLVDALGRVVDGNAASLVVNPWSEPADEASAGVVAAFEQVFQQGALQGIGFLFPSGDHGDGSLGTGPARTEYPASDPYVTSVGATSTAIGARGQLVRQTGWGTGSYGLAADGRSWVPKAADAFVAGSGGGVSTVFGRPGYQDGVVPADTTGRAVPDVAMDGDPTTGMLVGRTRTSATGTTFEQDRVGGTSLAALLMAGVQALAEEHAGSRLGFANPAIYALAGGTSAAFTDVRSSPDANVVVRYANGVDASQGLAYELRTSDQDAGLTAAPGWDDVTGIGSPSAGYLDALGS